MMKRILLALPLVLSCSSRVPPAAELAPDQIAQAIQGGQNLYL